MNVCVSTRGVYVCMCRAIQNQASMPNKEATVLKGAQEECSDLVYEVPFPSSSVSFSTQNVSSSMLPRPCRHHVS